MVTYAVDLVLPWFELRVILYKMVFLKHLVRHKSVYISSNHVWINLGQMWKCLSLFVELNFYGMQATLCCINTGMHDMCGVAILLSFCQNTVHETDYCS
jgi:hypothetical protein